MQRVYPYRVVSIRSVSAETKGPLPFVVGLKGAVFRHLDDSPVILASVETGDNLWVGNDTLKTKKGDGSSIPF